ncbi:MAG: hypothetical protein FJZ01_19785 [Candidatus Sericytochromatia bacterium]|nr:hypothetical protein [Candidatus Tanganyikabacteria bacterium]
MLSRQLVATVALGSALAFSTGCSNLKYRLSAKDDAIIMIPESASASVKGKFENSEGAIYWRPSEYWGESPYSYVSDTLGRTVGNRPVTNVRVGLDKNGFISWLKSTGGWVFGLMFFFNQVSSAGSNAGSQFAQVFSGDFSAIGQSAGTLGMGLLTGLIGWSVIQWGTDYLIPDLYGIKVEGDYVDAPANLAQGKPKAPAAPAAPAGGMKMSQ